MDLLSAFSEEYADTLSSGSLEKQVQTVKDALYRRSYVEAFGSVENLRAYVVRWSPSRALAYAHIFGAYDSIRDILGRHSARVVCIGGGAGAEIAALATFPGTRVTTIDQGDWAGVVMPLAARLGVQVDMIHGDAMALNYDFTNADLVTSLFTTNELFAESKAGAVKLLNSLERCRPGAIFVAIESAGSYSEISVGSKKFPVYFIIHHTLTAKKSWQLVDETDSEWFRLDPALAQNYPLKLENMRYFLRVYRRV